MTTALFAQRLHTSISEWSLAGILKALLIIGGVIAIAAIVMRVIGWFPPDWAVKIFWIVVAIAIGIFAIDFLLSL